MREDASSRRIGNREEIHNFKRSAELNRPRTSSRKAMTKTSSGMTKTTFEDDAAHSSTLLISIPRGRRSRRIFLDGIRQVQKGAPSLPLSTSEGEGVKGTSCTVLPAPPPPHPLLPPSGVGRIRIRTCCANQRVERGRLGREQEAWRKDEKGHRRLRSFTWGFPDFRGETRRQDRARVQ